jgi:hypothetical protein
MRKMNFSALNPINKNGRVPAHRSVFGWGLRPTPNRQVKVFEGAARDDQRALSLDKSQAHPPYQSWRRDSYNKVISTDESSIWVLINCAIDQLIN